MTPDFTRAKPQARPHRRASSRGRGTPSFGERLSARKNPLGKELTEPPMEENKIVLAYLSVWLTLLGAVFGSFTACAVSRWAAGEPPFRGRSRCVTCGHVLSAFDLIPVFSWVVRRGRCKYCGAGIPVDCLAAELAGGLSFLILGLTVPLRELGQWLIWAGLLLALSLADWARRLIPDRILLALVVNRIVWFVALEGDFSGIFDILLACLVPAALLALILLGEWLTARELMGGGDIKLLFALALYLSWAQLLLTLLAGCLLGLVFAALLGKKRDAAVPFGPFLALGGLFTVSLGAPLIRWYFGLF